MSDGTTISFASDIRPLFTDMDVDHMKGFGIDLSSCESVREHAGAIYRTVSNGTMPPPGAGEGRWTEAMCAKFAEWQTANCPP
ncbi:MAG TPA: hypothetical protein VHX17_03355 [Candidatus Cybelea sp.]|jgi:hypothetical protein|nr:hypothetical protein [Candidatus Cybelea sp.]